MTVANSARFTANTAKADADALKVDRDEYLAALQASVQDRAALRAMVVDLQTRMYTQEARAMTPGPKGEAGAAGTQGLKGDPGTPADMTRVAALEVADNAAKARLAKLEAKALTLQTQRYVTALQVALNGTVSFSVTWPIAFPDANYESGLTQSPAVTNVVYSNKTATGVTVTAKAGLLLAIGTVFTVEATRYA